MKEPDNLGPHIEGPILKEGLSYERGFQYGVKSERNRILSLIKLVNEGDNSYCYGAFVDGWNGALDDLQEKINE
jgi:hypothetical protein